MEDLREEIRFTKAELHRELSSLAAEVDLALQSMEAGKYYRLGNTGFVRKGEQIAKLTERLLILEKVVKNGTTH